MPVDPKQVQALFLAAVECTEPAERAAALDHECGGDFELRARVDALLKAHDEPAELPQGRSALGEATVIRSEATSPGALIAGRYKLLEEIAEGGMGTVWIAQQTEPVRRRVALKLIKPGMDSRQVLSRFEVERQALALMDHPYIAKVLDGGMTDEGRPFFVMEYVKGVPITEYCDEARLTVRERLALFVQVCQAVQHAHQKGIIHRDLKPSNILVCLYDGQPVPKVIDFGLAKAMHQPLTEHTLYTAHGEMVGTPLYMSPEQAEFNNLDIDTRSDVYSLGVILYELLTGSTPIEKQQFKTAAWQEIVRLIKEAEPTKPSTKLSGGSSLPTLAAQRSLEPAQLSRVVRGDLDWIVMKSLEKDRSRRYETAFGLSRDIERYLHDETVEASPPSASYRFRRFARRNRAALTTALLVAVAMIAGTILSAWQATRAIRAERRANSQWKETELAWQAEAKQKEIAISERNRADETARREMVLRDEAERERDDKTRRLYISQMHVVERAWDDNNVGRARELLAAQAPENTGGFDLRGWEWNYRWRLCHSELRTLNVTATSVAFSPDGTRLVLGGADGRMTIYSGDGTRTLRSIPAHHDRIVRLAFTRDGKLFATASKDTTVKLWETATGRLLRTFAGSERSRYGMALSPDGKHIAIGVKEITISDTKSGKEIRNFKANAAGIEALAFSPDGNRLVAGSAESGAELWNVTTGLKVRTFGGHKQPVTGVAFSPNGKVIVSGSAEGVLKSWDVETGEELKTFAGHLHKITGLAFNSDGTKLVSASDDATAMTWDVTSGQLVQTLKGHAQGLTSVDISPTADIVATGSWDDTIRLWDANSRQEPQSLRHRGAVTSIAYSYDNKLLAAISPERVAAWDLSTGLELWSEAEAGIQPPRKADCLRFDPNSKFLACGTRDGNVRLRDARDGRVLQTFKAHNGAVTSLDFSRDGRLLATGGEDQAISLWSLPDAERLARLQGHSGVVTRVAFSPDGTLLASASAESDANVRLWDVATRREVRKLVGHDGAFHSLTFNRDGRMLVTGGNDNTICWWNVQTGRLERTQIGHSGIVEGLSFSPDGKRLASCSEDQTVRIWDVATNQELQTLKPGAGRLWCIAFGLDGMRLAAGSDQGQVIVWDARSLSDFRTGIRIAELTKLLLSHPEIPENWKERAEVHIQRGRWSEAQSDAIRYAKLRPGDDYYQY